MATITEDYVSFETAKLLKKKGFDGKCSKVWIYSKSIDLENNAQLVSSVYFWREPIIDNDDVIKVLTIRDRYEDAYLCPTLQMAMKWLREVHKINIEIITYWTKDKVMIYGNRIVHNSEVLKEIDTAYRFYEQACEAAIKYCLENLIRL